MIFENNDHNVTLVEFFIFVMHICCHVINRKKLNASPPGIRDGGKDGKMDRGEVCISTTLRTVYTRAPLIACNLVTKVHHLTDEGQASHMRNQCFFTHEAMAP